MGKKGKNSNKIMTFAGLKGTQTRPVLGWMQKGAFSRWFMPFDTAISNLRE